MFSTALLVMNVMDAKQLGGAKAQPARVTSAGAEVQPSRVQEQGLTVQQRQEMLNKQKAEYRAAQEQIAQVQAGAPSPMAGPVSSKEWSAIVRELTLGSPSIDRINQIKQMDLTDDQMAMLSIIEQNILLKKQLVVGKTAKVAKKKKQEGNRLRGWFGDWWSGETANVENYKYMILAKLNDAERYPTSKEKYPTLASKQDALNLGIEFFDAQHNDQNIMEKAIKAATQALSQTSDSNAQQRINVLNSKMRKYFKFDVARLNKSLIEDKIIYLENYLKNNEENLKTFVAANITNENVVALLRTIISERARLNTMINSLKSLKAAQEKSQESAQEANAEYVPSKTPQGRPAGNLVDRE